MDRSWSFVPLPVLGLAVVSACGIDPSEAGRSRLRDAVPSDLATSVALMQIVEVPQTNGTPLRISRALGSGVLLCPNAVLTVQHVTSFGPMTVTNREVALSSLPGTATDATGERRSVTLRLPTAEDAQQVGEPVTRTLVLAQDARFGTVSDGLAVMRIEPPFPADLPYPAISTVTDWAAGEVGEVHGYGPSALDESDIGRRRKADLSFLGLLARGPQPETGLLTFGDTHSVEGDSGGPIFGPRGRGDGRALAGLDVGVFPGRPVSVSFHLAANADWIRTERDRICPARTAWAAPDEEPTIVASADEPAVGGGDLAAEAIVLSGDLEPEVGPNDVVCVCDGGDCTSCDAPAEEPIPTDACADYDWGCFCVPCDGWDDGGDGCCDADDESTCETFATDPACAP